MPFELVTILKLAPLAGTQLQRYRRSKPSKTLDRRVLDEFENDARLGPAVTESLQYQWLALHNDGRVAVILAGLLDDGDTVFLEALQQRCLELLAGLETLPLSIEATVERIVQAVRNNFVASQKNTDDAVQRGTSAVLSSLQSMEAHLQSSLDHIERKAEPSTRVILLASAFDDDLRRHVADLKELDEAAAGRLAEILEVGGVDGIAATVAAPPGWATSVSAVFWETSGRILADAGRYRAAQQAFERQNDTPGVADRVEALMAAARAADADKRPDDADALVAQARAINPEHATVALFAASRADEPEERLRLADAVDASTDKQRARKEIIRAIALLGLGRYDDAEVAAHASSDANPAGGGRELASLAVILAAREKLPHRTRDDRPLVAAVDFQWSLFEDLRDKNRLAMAGVAGARAALGHAVLGDSAAATAAIDAVRTLAGALVEPEARSMLVGAAMAIGDGVRARPLAEQLDDPLERRLASAAAALLAGDGLADVVQQLDELLTDLPPGDVRTRAVQLRLGAAAEGSDEFDSALAAELDEPARTIAEIDASRAMAAGDYSRAAAAMSPYDDSAALAVRSDIADRAGNLSEAIGLQAALVRRERSAVTILRLATLRARAGDYAGAIREAMRVATDERKVRGAREAAYALAGQAATDAGDWDELEEITERWAELSPDREDPKWGRSLALARQGRHEEGLRYARAVKLEPTADGNRHLLFAELVALGVPDVGPRLRALMELSDQFDRPQELEQAFIGAVLTAPSDDRGDDEEIVERFQDAMSTFEERFPDSGMLRSIAVDPEESPEALVDKLAAVQGKSTQEEADARQEFIDGVRLGRLPIALLAAMVGRGTAETILRNGAHPLGVFDDETHAAELTAAQRALEQAAATWDESACITIAELPQDHAQRLRAALPNSLIGQSVRDSLVLAARTRPGGEEVATMQVRPDGTVQIFEEDPELVAHVREVEAAAARVAEELPAHPDRRESDRRLAELLGRQDRPGPLAAVASALMAAEDLDFPLYSDDRVLRGLARSMGVPTFGTVALVDAMQRQGLIDEERTLQMLNAIVDLGIWGLMLNPSNYVDAARRAGYSLKRCMRPLLADEVLLRHDHRLTHNALLLRAVAEESPDDLDGWTREIMSSYSSLLELDPHLVSAALVALQFDPTRNVTEVAERQRTMGIVEALRARDYVDREDPLHDPLLGALRRWLHAAPQEGRDQTMRNLLSHIPPDTAAELRRQLGEDDGRDLEARSRNVIDPD